MENECIVSEKCLSCKKCLILKYVKFDLTTFVLLPLHIGHDFVKCCSKTEPISAGFYNVTKKVVFGCSESLNLKSCHSDSRVIECFLGL